MDNHERVIVQHECGRTQIAMVYPLAVIREQNGREGDALTVNTKGFYPAQWLDRLAHRKLLHSRDRASALLPNDKQVGLGAKRQAPANNTRFVVKLGGNAKRVSFQRRPTCADRIPTSAEAWNEIRAMASSTESNTSTFLPARPDQEG